MSTDRSNVGKGDSATVRPLAQAQLLDLVDQYFKDNDASEPTEVINDLLYRWLTLPLPIWI